MVEVAFGLVVLVGGIYLGYFFGYANGYQSASALRDECERAVHGAPKADPLPGVPDLPEATVESDYASKRWSYKEI